MRTEQSSRISLMHIAIPLTQVNIALPFQREWQQDSQSSPHMPGQRTCQSLGRKRARPGICIMLSGVNRVTTCG